MLKPINENTLRPSSCSPQPKMPQVLRLGHLAELGAPVLMPLPVGISLRIIPDGAGAHNTALSIAEQWMLQLLLQSPADQFELFVYDTSLDTSLPTLEKITGICKARGLPSRVHFIADPGSLLTHFEQWQADARQRKSHLLQSDCADWRALLEKESGQPLRLIVFTRTDDLMDAERTFAALPSLVQHGPRFGYWFWLIGDDTPPVNLRSDHQREQWQTWFRERIVAETLDFEVSGGGRLQFPEQWRNHPACKLYAELGETQADVMDERDRSGALTAFLAPRSAAAEAVTEADFWNVAIGQFQGQPFSFRMGAKVGAYHALIGGMTGSGKSHWLRMLIATSVETHSPDELRFVFMDLLGKPTFEIFADLPHTEVVFSNTNNFAPAIALLQQVLALRDERNRKFIALSPNGLIDNISAYNRAARERGIAVLPHVVIVIDEAQKIFVEGDHAQRREATRMIENIAREGRAYGICLLLASQTFIGVDLPRAAQNQFRMRLALRLKDAQDCNSVFGSDSSNHAATNLADRHIIVNDDGGRVIANRVVAIDDVTVEAIYLRMQRAKEKWGSPVDKTLPIQPLNASTTKSPTGSQPNAASYQPGTYAQYKSAEKP